MFKRLAIAVTCIIQAVVWVNQCNADTCTKHSNPSDSFELCYNNNNELIYIKIGADYKAPNSDTWANAIKKYPITVSDAVSLYYPPIRGDIKTLFCQEKGNCQSLDVLYPRYLQPKQNPYDPNKKIFGWYSASKENILSLGNTFYYGISAASPSNIVRIYPVDFGPINAKSDDNYYTSKLNCTIDGTDLSSNNNGINAPATNKVIFKCDMAAPPYGWKTGNTDRVINQNVRLMKGSTELKKYPITAIPFEVSIDVTGNFEKELTIKVDAIPKEHIYIYPSNAPADADIKLPVKIEAANFKVVFHSKTVCPDNSKPFGQNGDQCTCPDPLKTGAVWKGTACGCNDAAKKYNLTFQQCVPTCPSASGQILIKQTSGLYECGCPSGKDLVNGKCVKPPECLQTSDCSTGKICYSNKCITPSTGTCTHDNDCKSGKICDGGECVEAAKCADDADCAADQICNSGVCRQDDSAKCTEPGQIWDGGLEKCVCDISNNYIVVAGANPLKCQYDGSQKKCNGVYISMTGQCVADPYEAACINNGWTWKDGSCVDPGKNGATVAKGGCSIIKTAPMTGAAGQILLYILLLLIPNCLKHRRKKVRKVACRSSSDHGSTGSP